MVFYVFYFESVYTNFIQAILMTMMLEKDCVSEWNFGSGLFWRTHAM